MKKLLVAVLLVTLTIGCTKEGKIIEGEVTDYIVKLEESIIEVDTNNDKKADEIITVPKDIENESGNDSFKKTNMVKIEIDEETNEAIRVIENTALVTEKLEGTITKIEEDYIELDVEGETYKLLIYEGTEYKEGTEVVVGKEVKIKVLELKDNEGKLMKVISSN